MCVVVCVLMSVCCLCVVRVVVFLLFGFVVNVLFAVAFVCGLRFFVCGCCCVCVCVSLLCCNCIVVVLALVVCLCFAALLCMSLCFVVVRVLCARLFCLDCIFLLGGLLPRVFEVCIRMLSLFVVYVLFSCLCFCVFLFVCCLRDDVVCLCVVCVFFFVVCVLGGGCVVLC